MKFEFGDRVVKASSTDRVVFPGAGLTKGDVLCYYRDHAELIVPELRDRPLTVERFNKGIEGEGFYQKHARKHFPAWLDRVEIQYKKPVEHPVVNDAAGLVYMANQNALAFHVPTATIASEGRPDRIIFDLDPPPGRFDLVVAAARHVLAYLDELELPTFLKTTGSKGLHVVVPVEPTTKYRQVYRFCELVAAELCRRHRDDLTTEFYKKDRGGRLLVDVDRNHFGATAVAAYSVRARPGAPVSLPITRDELDDPKLAPDWVGIRELPARLQAVGNLWAGMADHAVPLQPAIDASTQDD